MSEDNLSLVIHKAGDMRLEQTKIPEIGPNEVLCKTHSCGICGTDIHLFEHGYMSMFVVKEPLILGHEVSALVAKVGKNVTHLKPGDRVAIEPAVPCGTCIKCREGMYNHCPVSNTQARGLPPFDGMLRRYFTHPADYCFKLPDNVSWEEGALIEPLAVAVHAARRVNLTVGQNILVCGSGTMGMMCMAVAKAYGAAKVIMTDINADRLKLAKSIGADETILIEKGSDTNTLVESVRKHFGGDGADITFECTGIESSTKLAIYATTNGGKVGLVGLGPLEVSAPLVNASLREVDIIGICRFRNCHPMAIYLLESGRVNLEPIVTHKFPLEESAKAFETMTCGTSGSVKVMIQCNKDFN